VGATVARALAQAGYQLAIHYRSSAAEAESTVQELQAAGVEAAAFAADLRVETEVVAMVRAVVQRFGTIDVLANCAAVWGRKPLEQITADDVREQFDTNTLGTFLMCQQVGLQMVRQPTGGCIINVGDWADIRPYPDYAAYFPSKAAIPGLTRTMAVELGTRNPQVRVNAILPGPVMLPPDLPAEERQAAIDATLVRREGKPEHVAQAVVFFAQNDFLTGVVLPVDGGRSIYAKGY
jgi:pteridine reductase